MLPYVTAGCRPSTATIIRFRPRDNSPSPRHLTLKALLCILYLYYSTEEKKMQVIFQIVAFTSKKSGLHRLLSMEFYVINVLG